jgi:hypothetical protein
MVKEIDGDPIIIGTSSKDISKSVSDVTLYEIDDMEFRPEMIYSILEGFDEVE